MKLSWPAPERNKQPILDVLLRVFPRTGEALELASGSGQHAVHFARALPALGYQPSDAAPEHIASIEAYRVEAGLPNLRAPIALDVCVDPWPVTRFDAAFNANLVHIAPWEAAQGLFRGVGRALVEGGVFVLYGPFRVDGEHTAESNARFDASLRAQDARWGVRDMRDIEALARANGLTLRERTSMPANNFALVFTRD